MSKAEPPTERFASVESLKKRAKIAQTVRSYFDDLGFIEVTTPSVVPTPCMDVHLDALEVRSHHGHRVGWLSTSPEFQMKRLIARGLLRTYQLGAAFRDDEHGSNHEREFQMLEWYRPGDSSGVINDTEQLVARAAYVLTGSTRVQTAWGEVDFEPPWPRVTLREAFEEHSGKSLDEALSDESTFFHTMVTDVEPKLGAERPVVITNWPASMASLARILADGTAERFEVYVHGIELCNGFGELTDAREQRTRFEAAQRERVRIGKIAYPTDERFINALQAGISPCAGNALGFDRLTMLLLGKSSIQSVIAFSASEL